MGQILEPSKSSSENEDILFEYKQFESRKGKGNKDSHSSSQMRTNLPNLALASNITDVFGRSASILTNAALKIWEPLPMNILLK